MKHGKMSKSGFREPYKEQRIVACAVAGLFQPADQASPGGFANGS